MFLAPLAAHSLRTHPQVRSDFLDRLELHGMVRQVVIEQTHSTLSELRRILAQRSSSLLEEAASKPEWITH